LFTFLKSKSKFLEFSLISYRQFQDINGFKALSEPQSTMSLNEITVKEEKSDDLNVIVKTSFFDESLNIKQEIKTEQNYESCIDVKVKQEPCVDYELILPLPPPSEKPAIPEPRKSLKDNRFKILDIKKEDAPESPSVSIKDHSPDTAYYIKQSSSQRILDHSFKSPHTAFGVKKEDAKISLRCNKCKIGFATIKELLIHQKLHSDSLIVSYLKFLKVN
jgi:hypothetical protein